MLQTNPRLAAHARNPTPTPMAYRRRSSDAMALRLPKKSRLTTRHSWGKLGLR
jgi:hypothetical protein